MQRAFATGRPELGTVVGLEFSDGHRTWLSVNAQPLFDPEGGEVIAVVVSFHDVTEQKQRAEFEQQLVGIVSHDLRNPISAMMMSAAALLKREQIEPAQLSRALARIVNSGERATRLVRDLLDFTQARLGSGIPVQRRETDLAEVARLVVDEVQQANPERELRWSARGDARGHWDPDRLAQIVANLAANAVAYSPGESVISIEVDGEPGQVSLTVHNLGEPIEPETLPRLFEPFRRGRDVRHGAAGNIGLGLFIVDQLVRAHGGTIDVHSTREQGTTFTVRLPR